MSSCVSERLPIRCAGSPPRKKNQLFRSLRPFRFDFFFTARNEADADVCGEHGSQQFLLPRIFDDALDLVADGFGDAARHLELRGRVAAVEGDLEADAEFAVVVLRVLSFAVPS